MRPSEDTIDETNEEIQPSMKRPVDDTYTSGDDSDPDDFDGKCVSENREQFDHFEDSDHEFDDGMIFV